MTKKKRIAIIYDTSYLVGGFTPLPEFIFSRRFFSREKPKTAANLRFLFSGKWGRVGAEQIVNHDGRDLFLVVQLIPNEVLRELERDHGGDEAKKKLAESLLKDGAARVSLGMDTIVGQLPALHLAQEAGPESPDEEDEETDKRIVGYAARLVSRQTKEPYDLAIVATEDEELLAELVQHRPAVLGVKSEYLTQSRLLHDKLTEIANLDRAGSLALTE